MAGRLTLLALLLVCVVWGAWLNYVATARVEGNCGQNNRRITFLTPVRGFYLEGHVISNHSVELNLDCQDQCALARECVSYNIGPMINNKMVCELSNSDHVQHPENLKPRKDWFYRGTENLCATNPCLNNGTCYMGYTEKKYACVCPVDFRGENCEVAFLSCSDLKKAHPTAASGYYITDPDGEGGLEPYSVYCDMTDKNRVGVTVISHDSERRTLVSGHEHPGRYSRNIHYTGASLSQLATLTRVSLHCEQFIRYECLGARILKHRSSWWVSRDSTRMSYWGGASPGSGKCACGMNNSCADPRYGCNCDKDDRVWREDSGLLTDKTKLPVKQLRFGDTGHRIEQGYHTLGKFKCYGTA